MPSDTLRFLRTIQNVKQKTIADILQMSQPNYSNLENGKTRLDSIKAEKLAAFYKVSKEVFFIEKQQIPSHALNGLAHNTNLNHQYLETNKELLDPILERMEIMLNLLADEKEELAKERQQLSLVFERLADKFSGPL